MSRAGCTRRQAAARFGGWLAASPLLRGQRPGQEAAGRKAPLDEIASVPELEETARRSLSEAAFSRIADGERGALDRITFRPRMMVNTLGLDLSLDLLGQAMFAPILVGPASRQFLVHPDGEAATARGAAAAQAAIVTAERSGTPLSEAAAAAPGCWRQVYPERDIGGLAARLAEAQRAGATVACLTLRDSAGQNAASGYGWDSIERLRREAALPLVLKGIMHPDDAVEASRRGIDAIIVSTHGAGRPEGMADPIAALPAVAEAVAGRIPVLVDGGVRRGGDVLKALALGATAVLVCRPALWGLAAYGADGVRLAVETLQTELARDMVQVGAETLARIRRDHVRVHRR